MSCSAASPPRPPVTLFRRFQVRPASQVTRPLVCGLSTTPAIRALPGIRWCYWQTDPTGGQASLVALPGGLHVTPWHPIRINGQWCFPSELRPPTLVPCPAVFSFVLDEGHVATINGVECVTLGHAFHEPVVHHEFFGTSSVVACLVGLEGWTVGRVRVDGVMRDPATGRACGLLQSPTSIPEGVPIPQVTPVEVAA